MHDHLLTSLNIVLIQVAESEVWLRDVACINNGLFICRISLVFFFILCNLLN